MAERYERYRLEYPAAVVDAVLDYAGRPVRAALEVGAGTGKATRLFASRGIHVTALEPDAEMARVLARTTSGLPVQPLAAAFEQVSTDRVDLVFAAAAWHWVDPATRWTRAVDLLAPGGVLALFGCLGDPADPDLFAAVEEIEQRVLPVEDIAAVHPWSRAEMARVAGLADTVQRDLPCISTTTASDFLGRLGTVSAFLMLAAEQRTEFLRQVRAVLPERFDIDTTVQLFLARRV